MFCSFHGSNLILLGRVVNIFLQKYQKTLMSLLHFLVFYGVVYSKSNHFLQKGLMTMAFFIIPIILVNNLGFDKSQIYKIYIAAMIFGLAAMGLSGALGEKRGLSKEILLTGIAFFIASYALFATENSLGVFALAVILFFIGFNMHEPIMQSLASKFAKSHQKGSALGIFNSFGFFGTISFNSGLNLFKSSLHSNSSAFSILFCGR